MPDFLHGRNFLIHPPSCESGVRTTASQRHVHDRTCMMTALRVVMVCKRDALSRSTRGTGSGDESVGKWYHDEAKVSINV